jgi:heme/copper-type cytochrome/quinol oxidase subunit 2
MAKNINIGFMMISTIFLITLVITSFQSTYASQSIENSSSTNLNVTNATSASLIQSEPGNVSMSNATLPMAMMNPSQMGSPIPDGERLFTEDKSNIMRDTNGSLVVEMVQTPKTIVAGQPATFVMNLFATNGTWLWHSDFDVSLVNNNTGEKVLVMPNIHGHGSMAQFSYAFPSQGTYNINITFGQQVNSPNYIKPHDVRTAQFIVNVGEGQTNTNTVTNETNATTQSEIKEIPVNVFSWGFEPNKIEVNKGDLVKLDFKTNNDEVSLYNGHGFGIEGYSINVFLVKGTNQTVEFEADKPGTFTFRCTSFCALPDAPESEHFGMTGTLVVHE